MDKKINVYNLKNPRTGREVPNQHVIQYTLSVEDRSVEDREVVFFKSYDSIVVQVQDGVVPNTLDITLDEQYWDYSVTTAKYRNQFLAMYDPSLSTTDGVREAIGRGDIKLGNLN